MTSSSQTSTIDETQRPDSPESFYCRGENLQHVNATTDRSVSLDSFQSLAFDDQIRRNTTRFGGNCPATKLLYCASSGNWKTVNVPEPRSGWTTTMSPSLDDVSHGSHNNSHDIDEILQAPHLENEADARPIFEWTQEQQVRVLAWTLDCEERHNRFSRDAPRETPRGESQRHDSVGQPQVREQMQHSRKQMSSETAPPQLMGHKPDDDTEKRNHSRRTWFLRLPCFG